MTSGIHLSPRYSGDWLIEELASFSRSAIPFDVHLHCSDGVLLLHRDVLSPLSATLHKILNQHLKSFGDEETVSILLPSVQLAEASALANLIYSGETLIDGTTCVENLKELTKILKLKQIAVSVVQPNAAGDIENQFKPYSMEDRQLEQSCLEMDFNSCNELNEEQRTNPDDDHYATESEIDEDIVENVVEVNYIQTMTGVVMPTVAKTIDVTKSVSTSEVIPRDTSSSSRYPAVLLRDLNAERSNKNYPQERTIYDEETRTEGTDKREIQKDESNNLNAFERHLKTNGDDEKPFQCRVCGKRYRHKSSLVSHLSFHDSEPKYFCEFCQKSFRTKDLRDSHQKIHGVRSHICSECGASFKQRNVLFQHKMTKHKSRRFSCNFCDKDFSKKQNLGAHLRIHSGEIPFNCEICDSKFRRSHHLQKHVKSGAHRTKVLQLRQEGQQISPHLDLANEPTSKDSKICEFCPSRLSFKSKYHYEKHLQSRAHLQCVIQQQGGLISATGGGIAEVLLSTDEVIQIEAGAVDQAEIFIFKETISNDLRHQ